jgi:uncharacterized protein YndB with AHSA1/START domain
MPTLLETTADFVRTASHRTVVERTIAAAPEAIWAALLDTRGWTEWFPGMSSAEPTSTVTEGIGSTRRVRVGRLRADERFVTWEPLRSWGFVVTSANLPVARRMLEQVDLIAQAPTPSGPSTLVRYTGAFQPYALAKPVFGLTLKQVSKAWEGAFENLVRRLAPVA